MATLRRQLETIGKIYSYERLEHLFINTDIPPEVNAEFRVYSDDETLEALKAIGLAYGLYSRAEELRGQRVHLTGDEGHTALVVQEDFSCHGSPCWETVRTLTEDPAEIQQYMAFRDVLRIVQQRDREERLPAKQRTGDSFPEHPPRQGGRSRER